MDKKIVGPREQPLHKYYRAKEFNILNTSFAGRDGLLGFHTFEFLREFYIQEDIYTERIFFDADHKTGITLVISSSFSYF